MNAIAARWEIERTRLWMVSALAVLLVHTGAMACLFLHAQPRLSIVGSPAVLNVELTSLPPSATTSASPATASTVRSQPARAPGREPSQLLRQLRPMADMQPISPAVLRTPSVAPPPTEADTASPAAELPLLTTPDLTALPAPQGPLGAQANPGQLWLSEVKDQLQRYKQYPPSAVRAHQQDTVTLRFSVNRVGQVTNVQIDSSHHYRALEQEVQKMLHMAGSLPPIPLDVPVEKVTWAVPVEFSLITPKPSPALPRCAAPDNPGPAPPATTSTLAQMNAYRARLNHYLADSSQELGCLGATAATLAARNALTKGLHALVDNFNAQAQLFQAQAQVRAQQARRQQVQALAAGAYASCNTPLAPQGLAKPLTAATADSYRRRLTAYQASVHSYIACIQGKQLALSVAGPALAADAKAALKQTATQDSNAAVLQFNRLAEVFTFGRQQTTFYSVSGLQVSGRHLAFNVGGTSAGASGPADGAIAVHFDLVLSADGKLLHGYCSTQQRRWQCTLARHPGGPG